VVAISETVAEKALELIDVKYEVLPAYFDPEESMKAQTDLIHDNKPNNLEKDYHHVLAIRKKVLPKQTRLPKRASSQRGDSRRHGAAFHAGFVRT